MAAGSLGMGFYDCSEKNGASFGGCLGNRWLELQNKAQAFIDGALAALLKTLLAADERG